MKVVCVSDTHGKTPKIPDGDLLIFAGDMANSGSFDEVKRGADWLQSLPHKHKVVIAGNHDWLFQREPGIARMLLGDSIYYLQDSCVTIDGLHIYGSPWQPYFQGWAFNLPRETIHKKWELIPEGLDILVTHGPPMGILDMGVGCAALSVRVEQVKPRVHVFGHIHPGYGTVRCGDTLYVNASISRDDNLPPNLPIVVTI